MTDLAWIIMVIVTALLCGFCGYWYGHIKGLVLGLQKGREDCESEWDGWQCFKRVAVEEKLKELLLELGLEDNDKVDKTNSTEE